MPALPSARATQCAGYADGSLVTACALAAKLIHTPKADRERMRHVEELLWRMRSTRR
ncbi:MAG TPA: hypothetical protein VM925_17435 [Labilithrix sp.]|nr:hypothetical protein [Labilithrix sp.]